MAANTAAKFREIEDLADRLRELVSDEDLNSFESLSSVELEAGAPSFDAAQWLEDVVTDRRAGLFEHVKLLQFTFGGMADTLKVVGRTLEGTDVDNASKLAAVDSWVTSVNEASVPRAVTRDHFMYGKDTYESSDNAGPNPELGFQVDPATGFAEDGEDITLDLPVRPDSLPDQGSIDGYHDLLNELPGDPDEPDVIFSPSDQVIHPSDPENSGGNDSSDGEAETWLWGEPKASDDDEADTWLWGEPKGSNH